MPLRLCSTIVLALALSADVAAAQAAPRVAATPGAIAVVYRGQTRTISAADLARLPRRSLRIEGRDGDSVTVAGVALWDVLQLAVVPPGAASGRQRATMTVRLTGADGQSAVLALVEVDPSFSRRPALLVDRRSERPLDAVEGPWRAILPEDLRHARWVRGVVSIRVSEDGP